MSLQDNFVRNVLALLKAQNMSQRKLCEKSGMGQPIVNRYLQKETVPGLGAIESIAKGLGTTALLLLQDPEPLAVELADQLAKNFKETKVAGHSGLTGDFLCVIEGNQLENTSGVREGDALVMQNTPQGVVPSARDAIALLQIDDVRGLAHLRANEEGYFLLTAEGHQKPIAPEMLASSWVATATHVIRGLLPVQGAGLRVTLQEAADLLRSLQVEDSAMEELIEHAKIETPKSEKDTA